MFVVFAEVMDYIYERTFVGVYLDPWEEHCGPQVAATFDQARPFIADEKGDGIPVEVFHTKKEQLGLIQVAKTTHHGKHTFYRRQIDMERLVRWEQGDKRKLAPEEWS